MGFGLDHPVDGDARPVPDPFAERDRAPLGGWRRHALQLCAQLRPLVPQKPCKFVHPNIMATQSGSVLRKNLSSFPPLVATRLAAMASLLDPFLTKVAQAGGEPPGGDGGSVGATFEPASDDVRVADEWRTIPKPIEVRCTQPLLPS